MNASNQIVGDTYDAAGNLWIIPGTGGATYLYNAENQMTSTSNSSMSYIYDGDGNRVEKSGSKIYWMAGTEVLDETDTTGSVTNGSFNEYVFFAGNRIARRDSSGDVFYYLLDQVDSSRVIAEVPSGQTTATMCYDADLEPYGGEHAYINTCSQNYKFTGKERDTESGLDNFGARYLGSSLGRFMTPDEPFYDGDIHDPQKLNLYSYVRNSPTTSIDPDGHRVEICDTNGQNCASVSNDAYAQAQQQDQYNHAPTLDQLQKTEGESQNIKDSNGNVVGTATRINDENAPVEGISPLGERYLAGYAMGAGIGKAFGAAWGAVAGWFGRGAEAAGATAGRATFQEILQGAVEESGQATKSGGIAQATKDFEALEGQSQNLGRVQMKQLPDGGKAVLRNFSKDGRPTLEYQPASGGSKTQWIRYNP